ncbi:helix-turn-helix transcriptional regulator [Saccharopolyspora sp. NFXS83]|uniref:helix-turn-helix transcriptional regulator n=1 Tax=Saccharopolyspora sp. NFXS83 TaxID=2993560 RepID=UPI00224B4A08|nr:helix-turn-helix transcriptional regulator [Saccharopolyspora sp. NFXS83]MCX2732776.1 helix-turn-helix transcriptional regulator [Saccharopolyspora sp. NFXS83]
MTIATVDPTQELAAFLRTRRERLDPDDFGLPRRRSRRTPGLRREEVAELAGISIDYVVRLEQARGLRPSADVVEALAGALRLGADERAYLFDLTRQRPRDADGPATAAAPPLARLVADLSPLPAMLMNHRFDVLAWNEEMARLLVGFDALPPSRRNAMWLCLLHPEIREFYVDRDRVLREGVAHLRTAWAAHPQDPALTGLISEAIAHDEEFARLWEERDVKLNGRGSKAMRHPEIGAIDVHFEVLAPLQDSGQRLMICRGADEPSRAALERLRTR